MWKVSRIIENIENYLQLCSGPQLYTCPSPNSSETHRLAAEHMEHFAAKETGAPKWTKLPVVLISKCAVKPKQRGEQIWWQFSERLSPRVTPFQLHIVWKNYTRYIELPTLADITLYLICLIRTDKNVSCINVQVNQNKELKKAKKRGAFSEGTPRATPSALYMVIWYIVIKSTDL